MKINAIAAAGLAAVALLGNEVFDPAKCRDLLPAGYWEVWNPQVQKKIDDDIIKNRQSVGEFALGAKPGTPVKVKQLTHAFEFGAQSFSFDQFTTSEHNARYRAVWGELFNSATIPFYWREMEPVPGELHTDSSADDCPDFWAKTPDREKQRFWRRPAPLPIIKFCDERKIRKHGHPLFWASCGRNIPDWLISLYPDEVRALDPKPGEKWFGTLSKEQFAQRYPDFTAKLNALFRHHIETIGKQFDGKLDSWDVINEAAVEMLPAPDGSPRLSAECPISFSKHGPMPGDFVSRTFFLADKHFPSQPQFYLNDWAMCDPNMHQPYLKLIREVRRRGGRLGGIGCQMHMLWRWQMEKAITGELDFVSPKETYRIIEELSEFDLPVRISEITIPALGASPEDEKIQAMVAYNLYRLWFSLKPVSGIVWWNIVDFQGASKEKLASGILRLDMTKKPVYYALDELINHQWKTNLTLAADADGKVKFRGFRGSYQVDYTTPDGKRESRIIELR